jgi:flagellar basal-body rod modification protein FlgD
MIVNNFLAPSLNYNMSTSGKSELGKEDFLQLMILQMQNQDPLDPMSNEEYIAQLAQFNALEQMQNLNKTVSSLGNLQILAQTSSMIGKNVEATDTDGSTIEGLVQSVDFKNGVAQLVLKLADDSTKLVTIDKILSVSI